MKKKLIATLVGLTCLVSMNAVTYGKEVNVIPFPEEYDTSTTGASSYEGIGNVKSSVYFPVFDFYNMKSTSTLTILPQFKTYQQTTESTCGPVAGLMVLHHFGETAYKELDIAKVMNCNTDLNYSNKKNPGLADEQGEYGTSTSGMVHFFEEIGWNVKSSLTEADEAGYTFYNPEDFKAFVLENLKNNTPIMVENIDFGGHWRVIIGYDTMGTDDIFSDDVIIMADSYDTSDHLQDGYNYTNAERFFYMWFDSHILPETQKTQQWLIATPDNK